MVRLSCPPVMAGTYLAPILLGYLALHPKVRLELNTTDREVNLIGEGFDIALRARPQIEDSSCLVARPLGMLPSVRSLIDYLSIYLPASIQEHSVDA